MREEIKDLENIAIEFEALLKDSKEQKIHEYLNKHREVLEYLHWNGFIMSKFRLAEAFIPDFIVFGHEPYSNNPSPMATFIEIERANEVLFTKSGQPTSFLTHAISQTQNWKMWVADNRGYLQKKFQEVLAEKISSQKVEPRFGNRYLNDIAHGFSDRYLVIAGRRNSMTIKNRLYLSQMNEDTYKTKVITYDVLLEAILHRLRLLRRNYTWSDLRY